MAPPASVNSEPPLQLGRLLSGLAIAVVAFDTCFWQVDHPGLSVAVFVLMIAGSILFCRERRQADWRLRLLPVLIAGGALAATIETGITNSLVLISLIVALAGGSWFREMEPMAARILAQLLALICAPGRIFWLSARILETAFGKGGRWMGGLIGGCLLAIPAMVLALVFGSLLATGNAVFGSWTGSFFDWFWKELALYLDPWRIALWAFAAFLMLPLLRPTHISQRWVRFIEWPLRFPEIVPTRGAVFSSALILVVLNFLFGVANVADLVFLWSGQTVPKGVTYSEFVHSGTNALTWTVLLSALVLTGIFQQERGVAGNRALKGLGLFWIAQNLFLLTSVALRLKLYIEAYDMTVLRLSVIIFLALVGVGYLLLTIKILRDRSLMWLIGGCVLAIFATFYVTQFLDLAGWSANYNVAQWEKNRTRNLDLRYICSLGAAGWPALRRATNDGAAGEEWADDDGSVRKPMESARQNEVSHPSAKLDSVHWREFSLRAWMNRSALDEKPHN